MAVTDVSSQNLNREIHTITITADGSAVITLPDRQITGISFTSDGVDGTGTLTWLVSNDNAQFDALGVNTSADPRNSTAVVNATAAGNWLVPQEALSFKYLKFTLAGSSSPTLVITVSINY